MAEWQLPGIVTVAVALALIGALLAAGCTGEPAELTSAATATPTGTGSLASDVTMDTPTMTATEVADNTTGRADKAFTSNGATSGTIPTATGTMVPATVASGTPTKVGTLYIESDSGNTGGDSTVETLAPTATATPAGTVTAPSDATTPTAAQTTTTTVAPSTTIKTPSTTIPQTTMEVQRTTPAPTTLQKNPTTVVPITTKTTIKTTAPTPTRTATPTVSRTTASTPKIWFTDVPSSSSSDTYVSGKVSGVSFSEYRVTVYVLVRGDWWGPKPYWDSPYTRIADDGTWTTRFVTGGVDEETKQFAAYLIPASYDPPDISWGSALPSELSRYPNARASR